MNRETAKARSKRPGRGNKRVLTGLFSAAIALTIPGAWTAVGLACCVSGQALAATATPADVRITFVELADLHANLISHKEMIRKPDGTTAVGVRGGIARIKTLIQSVKQSNPNTIVMNVGDTFHGGVEAFYTLGNAVADPLNALGVNVGVAGN